MSSLLKTVGIALTKGGGYGCNSTEQLGGGQRRSVGGNLIVAAFVWTLVIMMIKVVLVHWAWNYLAPRLMPNNYRLLSIADAIVVVILAQSLFN